MRDAHRILVLLAAAGCAMAPVTPSIHAERDTGFVTARDAVLVETPDGLVTISLDGRERRPLFGPELRVLDLSDDGQTFVLRGLGGELVVGDAFGNLRTVPLATAVGDAALSPDGRTLAAIRLGGVDVTHGEVADDDTVELVDVSTLAVRRLEPERATAVHKVAWSADGKTLWLQFAARGERINLADGFHSMEENPLQPLRVRPNERAPHACAGDKLGLARDAVDVVARDGQRKSLLRRSEGAVARDIEDAFFAGGCGAIVFVAGHDVYVVDRSSGRVGHLAPGDVAFPLPSAAADGATSRPIANATSPDAGVVNAPKLRTEELPDAGTLAP